MENFFPEREELGIKILEFRLETKEKKKRTTILIKHMNGTLRTPYTLTDRAFFPANFEFRFYFCMPITHIALELKINSGI
jgi:hypothetical protein